MIQSVQVLHQLAAKLGICTRMSGSYRVGSVKKVRSESVQGCSVMQTGDFIWEVKELVCQSVSS